MRALILVSIIALAIFPASAEEDPSQEVIKEKIEVIGYVRSDQAMQSVSVFGYEELLNFSGEGLKSVLNMTPGMLVLGSGNPGQLAYTYARGAAVNQVMVLVDGVKLVDPSSSIGTNISNLPLDVIEKVEIVRGPLSSLYGSNAMGGVINLVTKKESRTQFSFTGGSHGTFAGDVGFYKSWHQLNLNFQGSALNYSDGQANDTFREGSISARAGYQGKHWEIAVQLFGNVLDAGIPFYLGLPTLHRSYQQEMYLVTLPVAVTFRDESRFRLTGSFHRNDYEFSDPDDAWNPYFTNGSTILELESQFFKQLFDRVDVTAGLDWSWQNIINQTTDQEVLVDDQTQCLSVYLNSAAGWERFALQGSIRYDRYRGIPAVLSPQFGAALNLLPNLKLRASYSHSFRAPTLPELTNPYWGNPDLNPEKGRSFEVGADFHQRRMVLGVTYFDSRYRDLIGYSPITWKFANLNQATVKGIELSARFEPGKNLHLTLAYTHLSSWDVDYERELLRRPENSLSVRVYWKNRYFCLTADMVYVGRRLDYDELAWSVAENPAFDTYNLKLEVPLGERIVLFARMSNILNQEYQEVLGYPAPLRRIALGFRYQGKTAP